MVSLQNINYLSNLKYNKVGDKLNVRSPLSEEEAKVADNIIGAAKILKEIYKQKQDTPQLDKLLNDFSNIIGDKKLLAFAESDYDGMSEYYAFSGSVLGEIYLTESEKQFVSNVKEYLDTRFGINKSEEGKITITQKSFVHHADREL